MARDCTQRLHHIFLKEKLEEYREMLKDTEKSFNEIKLLSTSVSVKSGALSPICNIFSPVHFKFRFTLIVDKKL